MEPEFRGTMDSTLSDEDIEDIMNNVKRLRYEPPYGSPRHQQNCQWMRDVIDRLTVEHSFLMGVIKESSFLEK